MIRRAIIIRHEMNVVDGIHSSADGFEFSQPMKDSGLTWNQATLDRYLTDPRGVVPGTKMAFGGVADAAKRQAIIDYLKAH